MTKTIDIHGYGVQQAKKEIEQLIASCSQDIKEIIVIHGYHSGNVLKDFIRSPQGIRSKRLKRKKYTMNQGQTILELY